MFVVTNFYQIQIILVSRMVYNMNDITKSICLDGQTSCSECDLCPDESLCPSCVLMPQDIQRQANESRLMSKPPIPHHRQLRLIKATECPLYQGFIQVYCINQEACLDGSICPSSSSSDFPTLSPTPTPTTLSPTKNICSE